MLRQLRCTCSRNEFYNEVWLYYIYQVIARIINEEIYRVPTLHLNARFIQFPVESAEHPWRSIDSAKLLTRNTETMPRKAGLPITSKGDKGKSNGNRIDLEKRERNLEEKKEKRRKKEIDRQRPRKRRDLSSSVKKLLRRRSTPQFSRWKTPPYD